jgi:hypothetical protein
MLRTPPANRYSSSSCCPGAWSGAHHGVLCSHEQLQSIQDRLVTVCSFIANGRFYKDNIPVDLTDAERDTPWCVYACAPGDKTIRPRWFRPPRCRQHSRVPEASITMKNTYRLSLTSHVCIDCEQAGIGNQTATSRRRHAAHSEGGAHSRVRAVILNRWEVACWQRCH